MSSQYSPAEPAKRATVRGQTVVELAMLLPVLTLLMLAALDLGRAYYFYAGVANASRVGAQYAMETSLPDANVVQAVIAEAAPYVVLTSDKVTIIRDAKIPGMDVAVKVVFQYLFLTPGANRIWGDGITMTVQSTGRYD